MTDPAVGLAAIRTRLTAKRDHGAVAIVVALMLSSGVLLGMAALAIDVGNLYAERMQLLNGADAAALKVAQSCADPASGAGCTGASAVVYADDNANDGAAAVDLVCGRGAAFAGCSAPAGDLTDCIGDPPADPVPYVEVHTSTRQSDGTTVLPPIFAQAVLGGGFAGATVKACARAAWGPPWRANGLALTISACDWNRFTANGSAFDTVERSFVVYDGAASSTCAVAAGAPATAGAGGFRWLTGADGDCRLLASVDTSYDVWPGDSRQNTCDEDDLTNVQGRPVLVPVFSSISGGGGSAQYTVSGFAAFVLTGWYVPGTANRPACPSGPTNSCIYGYFTQAVVSGGGVVGGPDLKARIVARVG